MKKMNRIPMIPMKKERFVWILIIKVGLMNNLKIIIRGKVHKEKY